MDSPGCVSTIGSVGRGSISTGASGSAVGGGVGGTTHSLGGSEATVGAGGSGGGSSHGWNVLWSK